MRKLIGKCLCGSIQYSSEVEAVSSIVCHCEDCQRHSGSAFSICVMVPKNSVHYESKATLGEYNSKGVSGGNVKRQFCKNCGSPVMSMVDSAPDLAIIKGGTLDDKSCLEPAAEYWCDSALPWVGLGDSLPKFQRS